MMGVLRALRKYDPKHVRKVEMKEGGVTWRWHCPICHVWSFMGFATEREAGKYLVRHGVEYHGHD